jgi:16S rRNA (guanine(966)-N(2))-methyltransferase RsmD
MRIIGGKYRSRRIYSPGSSGSYEKKETEGFRPTTDRAKETLFNVLNNIIDFESVSCLDLFAGSGALGFETLSRGAQNAVFVESSIKQLSFINKTISELKCEEKAIVVRSDAVKYLLEAEGKYFDIIFADPPYDYHLYEDLIMMVLKLRFSVFVLEHSSGSNFLYNTLNYDVIEKRIGAANFWILISKDQ